MCLRYTAAGMLEAERQFRRIIRYHDLAKLVVAIDNERERGTVSTPTEEAASVVNAEAFQQSAAAEIPRRAGHPPCDARPFIAAERQKPGDWRLRQPYGVCDNTHFKT